MTHTIKEYGGRIVKLLKIFLTVLLLGAWTSKDSGLKFNSEHEWAWDDDYQRAIINGIPYMRRVY
jgi:hypothetical protein